MSDLIDRQAAIDAVRQLKVDENDYSDLYHDGYVDGVYDAEDSIKAVPSAQPESTRTFVELVVEYSDPELCVYKEYKGKPYYSIKYIENGETYVGYGTYSPKVLSRYLREYFMIPVQPGPSQVARDIATIIENEQDMRVILSQPEIIMCKGCKHQVKEWRTDKRLKDNGYMVCGCDIVGDACGYWALLGQDDDYCSMAERRTDGRD